VLSRFVCAFLEPVATVSEVSATSRHGTPTPPSSTRLIQCHRGCWPIRRFAKGLRYSAASAFPSTRGFIIRRSTRSQTSLARSPMRGLSSTTSVGRFGTGVYRGKRNGVFTRKASIKALATHQNVFIKVGGLGMALNGFGFDEQPETAIFRDAGCYISPYVETCLEAFGTARSMLRVTFPVDKASYSYPVFWNACKLLAKGASSTEKADLFAATAARFYRLVSVS